MASILRSHGHDHVEFFKIDIEGSELQLVPPMLKDREHLSICQIMVEACDFFIAKRCFTLLLVPRSCTARRSTAA